MALSLNNIDSVQTDITTGYALKTAALSKSQQELEGEMALKLIASAGSVDSVALPTSGSSGYTINIKV